MIYMSLKLSFFYLPISQPINLTNKVKETANKMLEASWTRSGNEHLLGLWDEEQCTEQWEDSASSCEEFHRSRGWAARKGAGFLPLLHLLPSFRTKANLSGLPLGPRLNFLGSLSQHCKENGKEWTSGQGANYWWYTEAQVWLTRDQGGKRVYCLFPESKHCKDNWQSGFLTLKIDNPEGF